MADEQYIDLQLSRRNFDEQVSDRDYVDLLRANNGDLQTVSGRHNLAQAVINRLLTRKGELRRLGHPQYGSRLYQLVGELNNARVRGLAEIYIRESLAQESRIAEITAIEFAPVSRSQGRNVMQAAISVLPVGEQSPFTISIPINTEG